jgi:hypothetical protein
LFLEAIRHGCHVRDACDETGINASTPYVEAQKNKEFDRDWRKAEHISLRALKAEAHRRAFHGTLRPIYQQRRLVGHIREYSDTLLLRMLSARDPKFRDKASMEVTGKNGGPVQVETIEQKRAKVLDLLDTLGVLQKRRAGANAALNGATTDPLAGQPPSEN